MKSNDLFSWTGSVVGAICTAVQTDQVFQWISLGLTILATIVSIAFTVWKWWKKASADGKITQDEVGELLDDLKEDTKDINKKGEHDD